MSDDLDDLITDAATAPSPEEARRALQAAEGLVRRSSDSIRLARAWVPVDPAEARRLVELGLRGAGLEVWTYRHAAELLADALGDRAAAAEALRRGEAMSAVDPRTGLSRPAYLLTLLGAGWRAILGDDAGYRRCVDLACSGSPTVDDRCAIARALDELGDGAAAAAELDEAEAALEREVVAAGPAPGWSIAHRHWTIAVAHDHRGAHHRARAVLARAASCASDAAADLALARAWHGRRHHDDEAPSRIDVLRDRARRRATTSADALAAAEATAELAIDGEGDRGAPHAEALRAALERAAGLATAPGDRIEVARAFRRLLGDERRASAIGPRGVRPSDLVVRRHPLAGWPRDPTPLLDHLRARVDDAALETIAAADYGEGREAHLQVLRDVRDTGLVPHPLHAVREVLQLTQHGTGRGVHHAARALCCALLLVEATADPGASQGGMESTLAVLCESGLAVDGAGAPLLPFLVAVVEGLEETEHLFGLLAIVIAAVAADPRDPRVTELVRRIIDEEPALAGDAPPHPEAGFLLRTTYFDGRHAVWRELVARVLVPARDATPALRELVDRLTPAAG